MLCLGIESSCDETALAVVEDGRLLDQALASQVETHALFGGVVPELASREHYRYIGPLYRLLVQRTGLRAEDLDVVAVARGPGLLGCLLVGMAFAKGLALSCGATLVGVNHLHGHLLAAGLEQQLDFPALGLLISGGHTHLYRMLGPADMRLLGRTLDDAAGEACDKFAKMLHLPYPGGALVDRLGSRAEPDVHLFPRPHTHNDSLDFSFSGLKTAAALYLEKHPDLVEMGRTVSREGMRAATPELCRLCSSYLEAVADTLQIKTRRALDTWTGQLPGTVIVAGGVAANSRVRRKMGDLAQRCGLHLVLPSTGLCTDNAAMIAYAGSLLAQAGLYHGLDLAAIPRGRRIPDDYLAGPQAVSRGR